MAAYTFFMHYCQWTVGSVCLLKYILCFSGTAFVSSKSCLLSSSTFFWHCWVISMPKMQTDRWPDGFSALYRVDYRHHNDSIITCISFWGFQSESYIMTVSAAVRLIPSPPALVHNKNTNRSESGLEKRSMAACLSVPLTPPSIRSYKYLNNIYTGLLTSH